MSLPSLTNSSAASKSFWQVFSIRDAIYIVVLAYMLMNQHFNNEQRLEKLEDANIQVAATLNRLETQMVPRKEHDASTQALNIRLGNIETAQNNIMTYLLNHSK